MEGVCDCPEGTVYVRAQNLCKVSEDPRGETGSRDADSAGVSSDSAAGATDSARVNIPLTDAAQPANGNDELPKDAGAETDTLEEPDARTPAPEPDSGSQDAGTPPVKITQLSASDDQTCALRSDGTVRCWGGSNFGSSARPQLVPGLSNAVEIATGASHGCARQSTGTVSCWGDNRTLALGVEEFPPDVSPIRANAAPVPGMVDVIQVASGRSHSCARIKSGAVFCWGRYVEAETAHLPGQPTRFAGFNAFDLKAGGYVTCARYSTTPMLKCLSGADTDYQVVGSTMNNEGIVQLSVAAERLCTLKASGAVYCWGMAPLGDGNPAEYNPNPVLVSGLTDVADVVAGGGATCIRQNSGAVYCWGQNWRGEAGLGTVGTRVDRPTRVPDLNASAVVAGTSHMCAIEVAGTVKCWGDNAWGQLGIGVGTVSESATPTPVHGLD
jgi:alpha-tubulin suppressor-like RCC1 family protein